MSAMKVLFWRRVKLKDKDAKADQQKGEGASQDADEPQAGGVGCFPQNDVPNAPRRDGEPNAAQHPKICPSNDNQTPLAVVPARGFDHQFGQQKQQNGVTAHREKVSEVNADGDAQATEAKKHDVFVGGEIADFFLCLVDDGEKPKSGQRNKANAPGDRSRKLLESVSEIGRMEQSVYLGKEVAKSKEDGKVGKRDLGHNFLERLGDCGESVKSERAGAVNV